MHGNRQGLLYTFHCFLFSGQTQLKSGMADLNMSKLSPTSTDTPLYHSDYFNTSANKKY